jgi:uncharacterized protein with HEPN domain
MLRDPSVSLYDILQAANYLINRMKEVGLDEYRSNQDLRFAVERNFITIGEAMASLRRHHPQTSSKLEQAAAVIRFRNFLVHQYWAIDNGEVWSVVHKDVPPLRHAVAALLEELLAEQ